MTRFRKYRAEARLGASVVVALFLLDVLVGTALAIERFPPPDFTDHALPQEQYDPARSTIMEYVDVVVLTAGLALASYLAVVRRWRGGLVLLGAGAGLWLGIVRQGCVCPIGAIQNVALALSDPSYAIPLGVVLFFTIPLVFALFFGRTFCAAVCPFGAIQEFVLLKPIRVPDWLDHALGLMRYIYLGLAVLLAAGGTAFLICRYDPFIAIFRQSGALSLLIFGGCLLVIGVFIGRPYCRYLCPYGALLGLASGVSKWHLRIPETECIQCRLCEDACPYGAIRKPNRQQTVEPRPVLRRRLAGLLVLLPLLIAGGYLLGGGLAVPLSKMHPTERLAERVHLENTGQVEGATDASDAFRNTGRPVEDLIAEAATLRDQYYRYGRWFGAWIGLVVGLKLVHLSLHRHRDDYQPDPARCVSCGRCVRYCPTNTRAPARMIGSGQEDGDG